MRDVLRVLAEPRRCDILRLIWDGERTAGEIAALFSVSRPAISQHLKVLRDVGVVSVRAEGTKRFYAVQREKLDGIAALLERSWADSRPPGTVGSWIPELD